MVAIFFVLTILVLVTVDALLRRHAGAPAAAAAAVHAAPPPEPGVPAGVFVHPGHTWAQLQTSGSVRVGLDEFVRRAVGSLTSMSLPRPGTSVRQGEPLASVSTESGELLLRAPISGTVEASNDALASAPQLLDRDTYGPNWLCALRPTALGQEIGTLRVAERAQEWLSLEMRRLGNWLADLASPQAGVAMQDGGSPVPGVITSLGDQAVWQGFQSQFLDTADAATPDPEGTSA
jgi:glycine cleavage system H protein